VDDIADGVAAHDIQAALIDEEAVGYGVEPGVVVDVVDVAVHVVVHPAGCNGQEPAVVSPLRQFF
jgi:hypothetical protein